MVKEYFVIPGQHPVAELVICSLNVQHVSPQTQAKKPIWCTGGCNHPNKIHSTGDRFLLHQ